MLNAILYWLNSKLMIADKGYDSYKFVHWIESKGGIAIIPSRITAKFPRDTGWHIYKERHLIEMLFPGYNRKRYSDDMITIFNAYSKKLY